MLLTRGFSEDFSRQKIVYQELSRSGNSFSIDTTQNFVGNSGYILNVDGDDINKLYYLLGFLNSCVMLYCLDQITTRFDDNGWRWLRQFVEQLRIPKMKTTSLASEIIELVKKTDGTNQNLTKAKINRLVASAYGFDSSEIEYIENQLVGY